MDGEEIKRNETPATEMPDTEQREQKDGTKGWNRRAEQKTRSVNNKKGIAPQVNDPKPHMDPRRIDANNRAGN